MQSSRDSSLWRSLAVAFGDGLAFGVGMKLTQRPTAPAASPAAVLDPIHRRLDQMAKRLFELERAPAAHAIASGAAPFDQKVLEAAVGVLDARLQEQAGHVESRIAELETKLAIELKSLEQHDRSTGAALQAHMEDLNLNFNDQIAALRRGIDEDRRAVRSEIASMHLEFAGEMAQAIERCVEEATGRHIARMRAELDYKDDQIAELREVILGFAQACRTLTERPPAGVQREQALPASHAV
jgi:hypothetical protein